MQHQSLIFLMLLFPTVFSWKYKTQFIFPIKANKGSSIKGMEIALNQNWKSRLGWTLPPLNCVTFGKSLMPLVSTRLSLYISESTSYASHSGNFTFKQETIYSDSLNIASKSSLQLLTGYQRSQCAWDQEGSWDMRFSVLKQGKFWANWDELVTLTSGIRPDLTSHWRKELGKSLEITIQETRAGSLSTKQTGSTDRSQRFTC